LKSIEEFRSQEAGDIPDQVAECIAGQNILGDLRLSELLDTAAKLFDRVLRHPSAIAEESAQLALELQKVSNGKSSWTPPRNEKRFNDPASTENMFDKNLLRGCMARSQSLQNFALRTVSENLGSLSGLPSSPASTLALSIRSIGIGSCSGSGPIPPANSYRGAPAKISRGYLRPQPLGNLVMVRDCG
jgi:hypothetical protein